MRLLCRWALSTLVLVLATLAFLTFSPSGDTSLVGSEGTAPMYSAGNMAVHFLHDGTAQWTTESATAEKSEYEQAWAAHHATSVHGGVAMAQGDTAENPPLWPIVPSASGGTLQPTGSFVDYVSGLTATRLAWYMLVVIPNLWLFLLIVKQILVGPTTGTTPDLPLIDWSR